MLNKHENYRKESRNVVIERKFAAAVVVVDTNHCSGVSVYGCCYCCCWRRRRRFLCV
jgi:hypothetical protein